jgi:hypothetical protein
MTTATQPMSALLEQYVQVFDAVEFPILLVGVHGVYKTGLIEEYAALRGLHYENIRAASYNDVDVMGFPSTHDNTLVWDPPYWLKRACNEPVMLFLDEFNRGRASVRNAFFQLADSRRVGNNILHPKTRIFGAVNPDNAKYFVEPFDSAELDRWFVIEFKPSVETWLSWARNNAVNAAVVAFIAQFKDALDPKKDIGVNTVDNSRRSWHRLSIALNRFKRISAPTLIMLCKGYLREDTADIFASFYSSFVSNNHQSTFDKIMAGQTIDAIELINYIKNFPENDWRRYMSTPDGLYKLATVVCYSGSAEIITLMKDTVYKISDYDLSVEVVNHPAVVNVSGETMTILEVLKQNLALV